MGEVIVKYKVMLDSESMSRIDEVCSEIGEFPVVLELSN